MRRYSEDKPRAKSVPFNAMADVLCAWLVRQQDERRMKEMGK